MYAVSGTRTMTSSPINVLLQVSLSDQEEAVNGGRDVRDHEQGAVTNMLNGGRCAVANDPLHSNFFTSLRFLTW